MLNLNLWMTCLSMVAVIIVVSFLLLAPQRWMPQEEESLQMTEERSKLNENYDYLLKEYEGKLAVYYYGASKPQEVFEVYISTLPEYDQKQLSRGLPVKDYEELLIRLEDYSS